MTTNNKTIQDIVTVCNVIARVKEQEIENARDAGWNAHADAAYAAAY